MPRIAHLSDVHLESPTPIQAGDLLSSKFYSFLRWRREREQYDRVCLSQITDHVKKQSPDLTIISGDIVNVGLPEEFKHAADWLRSIGPAERVCVVPPSGDPHMRGALKFAHTYWNDYLKGVGSTSSTKARYPYVRKIDNVAVICCSHSVTDEKTSAKDRHDEIARLFKLLQSLKRQGYFRIVTIDQNPAKKHLSSMGAQEGARALRNLLRGVGAELIIHAHQPGTKPGFLGSRDGVIPIVGVSTAAGCPVRSNAPARYHQFDIKGSQGQWSCVLQDIGYTKNDPFVRLRNQVTLYDAH